MPKSKKGKKSASSLSHLKIRPIDFGGFYYEDETFIARRVEVEIVTESPDGQPEAHHETLPVSLDGRAEWIPPRPLRDVVSVTFVAQIASGTPIAPPRTCVSWPGDGGYITLARAWTYVEFGGFTVESDLRCETVEPLRVRGRRPSSRPRIRGGLVSALDRPIEFGGFYYDDDTGGIDRVDLTPEVLPEGSDNPISLPSRPFQIGEPQPWWPDLHDVVGLSFQPYVASRSLGEPGTTGPGAFILQAYGRTEEPLVRNVIYRVDYA